MRFVHTADWQLGKPFGRIGDPAKRARLQQARTEAVLRIAEVLCGLPAATPAEFVVVAGDLFDSPTPDKATVSSACAAIGAVKMPVIVIPGNHDHAGPGAVWEQEFFERERQALAPNLRVLLEPGAVELDSAVLLACPLAARSSWDDPTRWVRDGAALAGLPPHKPRIVIAHGSVQAFRGVADDEEDSALGEGGVIDLEALPAGQIDYVALGDWHGTMQVRPSAWYAGTPEPDRFPRGSDYDTGNILLVEVQRGEAARVEKVSTAVLNWYEYAFHFADDASVAGLERDLERLVGGRAGQDLLRLMLTGSLGLEARERLQRTLETLEARLLRLKLVDSTTVAPREEELAMLVGSPDHPLIAKVAARLLSRAEGEDEEAEVARAALRELYAAYRQELRT